MAASPDNTGFRFRLGVLGLSFKVAGLHSSLRFRAQKPEDYKGSWGVQAWG